MDSKTKLRTDLLSKRRMLSSDTVARCSALLCSRLRDELSLDDIDRVVAYAAFDNEVDVSDYIDFLYNQNIDVFYPKCIEGVYHFVHTTGDSIWAPRQFNVLEPEHKSPLLTESQRVSATTLWLVPGVGFGKHNERLGFGKGIYDRALNGCKGPKIGLCYDFQADLDIHTDAHDINMNRVIKINV